MVHHPHVACQPGPDDVFWSAIGAPGGCRAAGVTLFTVEKKLGNEGTLLWEGANVRTFTVQRRRRRVIVPDLVLPHTPQPLVKILPLPPPGTHRSLPACMVDGVVIHRGYIRKLVSQLVTSYSIHEVEELGTRLKSICMRVASVETCLC